MLFQCVMILFRYLDFILSSVYSLSSPLNSLFDCFCEMIQNQIKEKDFDFDNELHWQPCSYLMFFTCHYIYLYWLHGFFSFMEKYHLFIEPSFFSFNDCWVQNCYFRMLHLNHYLKQHLCFEFKECYACSLDLLWRIYLFFLLLFLTVLKCKPSNLICLFG